MVQASQKLTSSAVTRTRQSVTTILLNRSKKQSRAHALRFAAAQVLLLEHDRSPLQQLLRFCYALAALEWHAEGGGLSDRNVDVLASHARAILAAQGVARERSKLGNLHGDLEACLSRIAATAGRHWDAALHSNLAYSAAMRASSGRAGYLSLDWGRRALRFGDATGALSAFDRAQQAGVDRQDHIECDLLRIRALRLSSRFDAALKAIAAVEAEARNHADFAWEKLTIDCIASGDFRPLAVAVHRQKPNYQPRNICLSTLYNLAGDRLFDRALSPRLETIIRRRDLKWPFENPLIDFVRSMDALDMEEAEPDAPESELSAALGRSDRLFDIEDELLMWAAAARLFARAQEFRLASLALSKYRALSLGLSGGRHPDVLGVVSSLMQRSWFTGVDANSPS